MALKQLLINQIKNVAGTRTRRKLVVFAVDDYGNVRLSSRKARKQMDQAGLKVYSRFDAFDTLETRQDLEQLFEVLTSVKDHTGSHAVFSPFALPCNINFEQLEDENFQQYRFELLPETYEKLTALDAGSYQGTWQLWQEGINKGLMQPQFHGREHLNVRQFEEMLSNRSPALMASLRARSLTSVPSPKNTERSLMAAFSFERVEEVKAIHSIISEGLDYFEKVFGYRATVFMPPAGQDHPDLYPALSRDGIKYIDTTFYHKKHLGEGKYQTVINYWGKQHGPHLKGILRNVVFEPTHHNYSNGVGEALQQIEAAFRWKKPAVISSHRVNFCGHIDAENRKRGLRSLGTLLQEIVKKWPDAEFVSSAEIGEVIFNEGEQLVS